MTCGGAICPTRQPQSLDWGLPESSFWRGEKKILVSGRNKKTENAKLYRDKMSVFHGFAQAWPMVCVGSFLFQKDSSTRECLPVYLLFHPCHMELSSVPNKQSQLRTLRPLILTSLFWHSEYYISSTFLRSKKTPAIREDSS